MKTELANTIKSLRKQYGLTQEETACQDGKKQSIIHLSAKNKKQRINYCYTIGLKDCNNEYSYSLKEASYGRLRPLKP